MLQVNELHVSFTTHRGKVKAVRGVTFAVEEGETVAIVGESGCGKSVTAQAILRLIDPSIGRIEKGEIRFNGKELTQVSEEEMEQIRGAEIAMIFQDPMTALNPTLTIGEQLIEGLIRHQKIKRKAAKERALAMLELVGIPNPEFRLKQYPHQLSGGMRQRVMIAIALSLEPKLLIADEPTTALDVTIQAQIMDLIQRLKEKWNTSILFITHDLGVVAEHADKVIVMYAGKVVESSTVDQLYTNPKHPYTWGLFASLPKLNQSHEQKLQPIPGSPPNLIHPPKACPFVARCAYAMNICAEKMPPLEAVTSGHQAACWLNHPDAPKVKRPVIIEGGETG